MTVASLVTRRSVIGLAAGVAGAAGFAALASRPRRNAGADELTVLLDWFVNPDHAPLVVAQCIGAFLRQGLDVRFVQPADPSIPPRMVAARYGDIAIVSQPTLYIYVRQGLPLVRVGALIDEPLVSLASIETSSIRRIADLKGRKIGIANISPELTRADLETILATAGLTLSDVTLVNVGDQLASSLLSRQIDAVPVVRTFESIELQERGVTPIEFPFEDYGVPRFDTFIYVVRRDRLADPRIARFVMAVRQGALYLKSHPDECLAMFLKAYPDLNNPLNRAAWKATLPYFASDPGALDRRRYETYADYLVRRGVLSAAPPLDRYAVQIT